MNSEFNQEINCKFYGKECRSEDHDDSDYCTLRMKRYFGLQDGYLCPMCETCSPTSWMDFYFMHGLHLTGYFDKSKTILAREIFNDEDYHPEIGYEKDLSSNYCPQIGYGKRKGDILVSHPKKPRIESNLNNAHIDLSSDISHLETNRIIVLPSLKDEVASTIQEMGQAKIQFEVKVKFNKITGETKVWWLSNSATTFSEEFYSDGIKKLQEKIENYTKLSSGWRLEQILEVTMTITQVSDLIYVTGSSYIESPVSINRSNAVVNVQNEDHYCFLYSILAVINYEKITSIIVKE